MGFITGINYDNIASIVTPGISNTVLATTTIGDQNDFLEVDGLDATDNNKIIMYSHPNFVIKPLMYLIAHGEVHLIATGDSPPTNDYFTLALGTTATIMAPASLSNPVGGTTTLSYVANSVNHNFTKSTAKFGLIYNGTIESMTHIAVTCSFAPDNNNSYFVYAAIFKNGVEQDGSRVVQSSTGNNNYFIVTIHSVVTVGLSDEIDLRLWVPSGNQTIRIKTLNFFTMTMPI